MPRWIAFDQTTLARLRRQFPLEPIFEHGARDIVDYAVTGPEKLVAVLPLGSRNEAAVAVFRRGGARTKIALPFQRTHAESPLVAQQRSVSSQPTQAKLPPVAQQPPSRPREESPVAPKDKDQQDPPRLRAGGMLGLRDEAVFEEAPQPQRKKTWWQRWWADDE